MAGRPFIVVGDQTDHGGVVIEGSGVTDTHGKKIARVGDQVTCPKRNHGTTVIVSGDATMIIDGKPAARHGDKCACGATLISSQFVSTTSDGGASNPQAASDQQKANAAAVGAMSVPRMTTDDTTGLLKLEHDQVFVLTDDLTGEPLAGWKYRLTCGSTVVEGVTDARGHTQKVTAARPGDVVVEVLQAA